MGETTGTTAAKPAWGKRIAALSLSTLLALLLAEGVMRVRQHSLYGTSRPSVHEWARHSSGLRIPKPGRATEHIRHDSRGFRSPELAMPKPRGRVRIAFLGGSTTYCAEVRDEETWPHLVWRALRARFPAADIDYVNAGVCGFRIEEIRRNLEHRVRELEPDVLFVYEATNDLAADTRRLAVEEGLFVARPNKRTWLEERSLLWHWLSKNARMEAHLAAADSGAPRLAFDAQALALGFRARFDALLDECRAAAPVVGTSTFAVRVRRDQARDDQIRACSTSLFYMPYMSVEGILDGFDAYNDEIRAAALGGGVVLAEAATEVGSDSAHFADSVHFNPEGCRAMADAVVDALCASPGFRALLEERAQHE